MEEFVVIVLKNLKKIRFTCEMERVCKTCLERINQKKMSSLDINMLGRKPIFEYYQMLPEYNSP